MSERVVILCPGQGAQKVGMGRAWYERCAPSRAVFDTADAVLGDALGAPLSQLCFEGPAERLNQTDAAQPALFAVGVAALRGIEELGTHLQLEAAAGLSLGEYTALHLAGSFDFATGLEIVALRGRAIQDAAQHSKGGMVALTGADEDQVAEVCARSAQGGVLVGANYNAPGQIVLSGALGACNRAVALCEELGLRATPLAVAGAFHSPLMQPAADQLAERLLAVDVQVPVCPVLSNVTAAPHEPDPDSIRQRLVEQLTAPVQWSKSCQWLASEMTGAFHELAPGKVLTSLMRRIDRSKRVTHHDEPD